MSVRTPVIIDTDPGIDDAIALAMALFDDRLDVSLITTVAGNVDVTKTTDNALKLLEFWGLDIPVAVGAARPLVRDPQYETAVHGVSGMEGYEFPSPNRNRLLTETAVEAIHRTLQASAEPATIVCLAPMTNLALLLREHPEDRERIARVIFMGGSTQRGNKGVLSEFNVHADPEAADIVLRSGLPLVMIPLDVGWKALVYPEDSARIRELNSTGAMIHGLLSRYRGIGLKNGLKMYDGCAIAYLLEPDLFTMQEAPVAVELNGTYTSGATLVDFRGYLGLDPNALVATDVDAAGFTELLLNRIDACRHEGEVI